MLDKTEKEHYLFGFGLTTLLAIGINIHIIYPVYHNYDYKSSAGATLGEAFIMLMLIAVLLAHWAIQIGVWLSLKSHYKKHKIDSPTIGVWLLWVVLCPIIMYVIDLTIITIIAPPAPPSM